MRRATKPLARMSSRRLSAFVRAIGLVRGGPGGSRRRFGARIAVVPCAENAGASPLSIAIDVDEKEQRRASADIDNGVGEVGAVAHRLSFGELLAARA